MTDEPDYPRVSTEDDGFPLMDDADSVTEQAALNSDDTYDEDAADPEGEH